MSVAVALVQMALAIAVTTWLAGVVTTIVIAPIVLGLRALIARRDDASSEHISYRISGVAHLVGLCVDVVVVFTIALYFASDRGLGGIAWAFFGAYTIFYRLMYIVDAIRTIVVGDRPPASAGDRAV